MEEDYRGQHEAPDRENGVPLHDTSGVYPPDFYGPNGFRYYADHGNDYDYRSYNAHVRLKDKPEEFVSVHRAIPSDVYKKALKEDAPLRHMIRPGDWVTPSKEYAKEHGEAQFEKNYKIASMRVKAKDVFTNGDSIHEWGYDPEIKKEDGGGITAYHGSPHDFDEFDMSKIGTGEGAQAYGHGLYFAESEPTAKYYKDTLAHRGQIDLEHEANQREMPMSREAMIEVRRHANGSVDPLEAAKHMHWSSIEARQYPQEKLADLIDLYRKAKQGHMYEVAIDAHPDHFLDWDKPLSEQSFHIGKSIFDARKDNPTLFNVFKPHLEKDSTGMGFYQSLATQHPNGYQGATDFLQRAGIPGIRYLDAGSRNAQGDPTHNYVVFDHNRVSVKRKYAQGGFIRRAYKKGGKVEGSIWHERDAFDEGGDVRAGDSVGGLRGDTGGFSEHDVGEAQGAVNGATAAAQEARQGMQRMDEAFGPARSGPETSAFNSGPGEPPPVAANIMPRSTTPGGILAGSQPPTPESSDYSIVNAFSAPKQMPIGITGIGVPSSGINMSQTPAQMTVDVSAEAGAPVGDPNNPASYFGGQPAQVASATGTPAGSISAMQPQHYEPMGNKMPDLTGVTAPAGNVQTAALQAPTVQPMAPHTLTPDTARTDLTGVTAPAGNVQMSALPAPNVQPNAPHSLTPNTASTPQPSVSSAYTETQPSIADQANAAIPTPMNGVPTPPIPLRDLQGPNWAEGIAGAFGLSTQQQFDKFNQQYLNQGMSGLDAYNHAINDIQTMRNNAKPGPFDRNGKTQKIQKLMPDGTYQWVDEPYKKGGRVHSRQIVDHVLSKFGASLPASNNPFYGNKAGRR